MFKTSSHGTIASALLAKKSKIFSVWKSFKTDLIACSEHFLAFCLIVQSIIHGDSILSVAYTIRNEECLYTKN